MKNVVLNNLVNHDLTSDRPYCYLLREPETNRVFYVGKGKRARFRDHLYAYTAKNHHKNAVVKRCLAQHGYIIADIVASFNSDDEAYAMERVLIETHRESLTNLTEGGDAPPKQPCRPVVQYNLYGEPVKTWASYRDAAASFSHDLAEIRSIEAMILECCRGAIATCRDFYWSYEGNKILKPRTKILPVRQLTPDGLLVARYESIAAAVRAMGKKEAVSRDIAKALDKPGRTSHGFRWETHAIANT